MRHEGRKGHYSTKHYRCFLHVIDDARIQILIIFWEVGE